MRFYHLITHVTNCVPFMTLIKKKDFVHLTSTKWYATLPTGSD